MNSKTSTFITILIIAVVVGMGVFFVVSSKSPKVKPNPVPPVSQNQTPTEPPKPPVVQTKTYTDVAKTFSFSYPTTLTAADGDAKKPWRSNSQVSGKQLASVIIPGTTQPLTNLSEATFTVGMSTDAKAIQTCSTPVNGEVARGQMTIGGVLYKKFNITSGAAGNLYDTTSYRTLKTTGNNKQCYAIEYTIHSTNIGNYTPDQGIKGFNIEVITKTLEDMAQSFSFTS